MALSQAVLELTRRLNEATDELASDLKALRDQITAGNMTEAEIVAAFEPSIARAEELGKDPQDPIPPVEPAPEPTPEV